MSSPQVAHETVDIEEAGAIVSIRMLSATFVSVHIRGDNDGADYDIDGRVRGEAWVQGIEDKLENAEDHDHTFETGLDEVRVRVSSGTGGDHDATITLAAGG